MACRRRRGRRPAAPASREAQLPADADTPRLTRPDGPRPGVGIVHLGLGAFFRAHGAIYVAEAMAASGGDWGVVGVSLVNPTQRDLLAPQGFAYTALELGPDGERPQVVDVLQDVLVAREDPGAVLAAMAAPSVKIVTLTVTEKGYCHEPSTGKLNRAHPDIEHDLAEAAPRSAPGFPGARPAAPAGGRARALHGADLRQPAAQRPAGPRRRDRARGAARPRSRGLDRGRGRLSLDHGRPHRAGDQARGRRAPRCADRRRSTSRR